MGCNSSLAPNKSFQSGCQFFLGSLFLFGSTFYRKSTRLNLGKSPEARSKQMNISGDDNHA